MHERRRLALRFGSHVGSSVDEYLDNFSMPEACGAVQRAVSRRCRKQTTVLLHIFTSAQACSSSVTSSLDPRVADAQRGVSLYVNCSITCTQPSLDTCPCLPPVGASNTARAQGAALPAHFPYFFSYSPPNSHSHTTLRGAHPLPISLLECRNLLRQWAVSGSGAAETFLASTRAESAEKIQRAKDESAGRGHLGEAINDALDLMPHALGKLGLRLETMLQPRAACCGGR